MGDATLAEEMSADTAAPHAVIACDKFKGSLSALDACQAIANGLPSEWTYSLTPIADGGEGFSDAMRSALGGRKESCKVRDPLGRIVNANYSICPSPEGDIAVMEMAEASGLHRVSDGSANVMQSSTFGTGQMMLDAASKGVVRIVIGIGGSATNDGGCGMARALGVRFYDRHDNAINGNPNEIKEIDHVDTSDLVELPPVTVACDVDNPLTGSSGASAVFGPQKGATEADIKTLDAMLDRVAKILKRQDYAKRPGAGAAGGLGFGLMVFAKAQLVGGFDLVAQTLNLESRLKTADLVITGEGSLDSQTLQGKGPAGIAMLARDLGVPCLGIGGQVTKHIAAARLFNHTLSLQDTGKSLDELMENAAKIITMQMKESADLLRDLVFA